MLHKLALLKFFLCYHNAFRLGQVECLGGDQLSRKALLFDLISSHEVGIIVLEDRDIVVDLALLLKFAETDIDF